MPLSQFIQENWILVTLLVIVIIAIIIYELHHKGQCSKLISNMQAGQMVNAGATLIDTRPAVDFKTSHIAGAKNITAEMVTNFIEKNAAKKEQNYVLYCKTGISAKAVAQKMKSAGFNNIFVLKAGIDGWQQDNLPTV